MNKTLGDRISHWGLRRGVTQAELARRTHFTPTMISYIMSGKRRPSMTALHAIAEALEVTESDLLDTEEPYPNDPALVVLMGKIERLTMKQFRQVQSLVDGLLAQQSPVEEPEDHDDLKWA